MLNVAIDVMTEDWGEKLKDYEPKPGFKEHLKEGKEPVRKLNYDPQYADLTCSEMVNHIIMDFPAMGSAYYLLVNGAYLGEFGDYSSCRISTTNGQYMLATLKGDYVLEYPYARGTVGKYQSFSP